MDIAAAIRGADANRAWIEGGRLNLVLPARGLRSRRRLPRGARGRRIGLKRPVVVGGECLPWRRKAAFEHLVLPSGYAPVGEMGARLMVGAAADEVAMKLGAMDAAHSSRS